MCVCILTEGDYLLVDESKSTQRSKLIVIYKATTTIPCYHHRVLCECPQKAVSPQQQASNQTDECKCNLCTYVRTYISAKQKLGKTKLKIHSHSRETNSNNQPNLNKPLAQKRSSSISSIETSTTSKQHVSRALRCMLHLFNMLLKLQYPLYHHHPLPLEKV
jgi:hypothetical protein